MENLSLTDGYQVQPVPWRQSVNARDAGRLKSQFMRSAKLPIRDGAAGSPQACNRPAAAGTVAGMDTKRWIWTTRRCSPPRSAQRRPAHKSSQYVPATACNFPSARFISALRPRGQFHDHRAARFLRRSTDRQSPSRQLPWRHHQIRGAAKVAQLHLLRRGFARDHGLARPGGLAQLDARGHGGLHRGGHRSQGSHHLQSESGERAF